MDAQTSGAGDLGTAAEEPYLRRAQALLAARAELFVAGTARSMPQREAAALTRRGRQLTLPLPREQRGRRARMVR